MGPGSFYWLALFFGAFGDKWQVSRLCLLATGVASALLVYWIARQFLSPTLALLPWLFAVVLSIPLWPASNHHMDSNLFALAAVACFLRYQERCQNLFLCATGILAGITSCFLQQKGCYLLLAFVVILFLKRVTTPGRGILANTTGLLLAGYLLVSVLVLFSFYRADALTPLINCTLLWPLRGYQTINAGFYPKSMAVALDCGSFFFRFLPLPLAFLFQALCFVPFLLLIALPLVPLGIPLLCASGRNCRAALLSHRYLTVVLCGLSLWLSEMHRKDVYHFAFGAPLLAIALTHLVQIVTNDKVRRLAFITAAIALLSVAVGDLWNTRGGYPIQTRRGSVIVAAQDDALSFLSKEVPERDWTFVYPYYPMYYYLANLRNPTRFSILLYHYNTPAHFDEVIHDLESKHVRFVLWDTLVDGANLRAWFAGYVQPPHDQLRLEQYLNTSFEVVSVKNGFRVLRRKPL